MCPYLIQKASNCDEYCPYRHYISSEDNFLPRTGQVQLKLFDVIATNRYAAHITHHRQRSSDEWTEFNSSCSEFPEFNQKLKEYFEENESRQHCGPLEPGQMCGLLLQNEVFRGRVISKNREKTRFRVLLVDVGKSHICNADSLLRLPDEFIMFPAQTVEIVLMGIEPVAGKKAAAMGKIAKWMLLAKSSARNCCAARLVGAFERTLLVKEVTCTIADRQQSIHVGKNLVSYGFAEAIPIQIHDVLNGVSLCDEKSKSPVLHSTPMKICGYQQRLETSMPSSAPLNAGSLPEYMRTTSTISTQYCNNGDGDKNNNEPFNLHSSRIIELEDHADIAAYNRPSHSPSQRKLGIDEIFDMANSFPIESLPISPIILAEGTRSRSNLMDTTTENNTNISHIVKWLDKLQL